MALLKSLLSPSAPPTAPGQDGGSAPQQRRHSMTSRGSFHDFSMGSAMEVEEILATDDGSARRSSAEYSRTAAPGDAKFGSSPRGDAAPNVWAGVFNPGRNMNMKKRGAERFDKAEAGQPSTWEVILKAQSLQKDSFEKFDANGDGFVTEAELRKGLDGMAAADIKGLFQAADRDGDGKISYDEWVAVIRRNGAPSSPTAGGSSPRTPAPISATAPMDAIAYTSSSPQDVEASRRASAEFSRNLKEARDATMAPDSPSGNSGSCGRSPRSHWAQGTFNPGRNFNMPKSTERFDKVEPGSPTTWDYIVRAQNIKKADFAQFDTNGDGFITADELRKGMGGADAGGMSQLMKVADRDGDGRISRDEWSAVMARASGGAA